MEVELSPSRQGLECGQLCACSPLMNRRSIFQDVRRGVVQKGVPGSLGVGQVGLGFRPRGEPLDNSMDADGLSLGFRPRGVGSREVTEAYRIEDRWSGRSMKTGFEAPALQGSKCAGFASGVTERML